MKYRLISVSGNLGDCYLKFKGSNREFFSYRLKARLKGYYLKLLERSPLFKERDYSSLQEAKDWMKKRNLL